MKQFPLLVFSIDRELFAGEASALTVPGTEGQLQILVDHAPLISLLQEGELRIRTSQGKEEKLPIGGGVVEVTPQQVVALVSF
ncbi:MAG: hypothetical protein ABIB12_03095 [Patescibacteria group bacterium]